MCSYYYQSMIGVQMHMKYMWEIKHFTIITRRRIYHGMKYGW
jgi:hypothetical protein